MATANNSAHSATPAPLLPHEAGATTNGHYDHHDHHNTYPPHARGARPTVNNATAAANKGKKANEQSETSRQIAAKISQLEVDNAVEKEQEAEIARDVRKHDRELAAQTNRMIDPDKINHLERKCSELFASMKRLERDNLKNKKRADQLQKDKDINRSEFAKQTGLKEKLEKLCRELQKENNKLKNEQRTLKDAHDKLKKDSDRRYDEVLVTLDAQQAEKDSPRKQVLTTKIEELFKSRFKTLIDQYELRELHYHCTMRTKEIETQCYVARYERQKQTADSESQRARHLNNQVLTFSKTETELRNQLNVYVDKFKQVEDTLNNSNDLFLTFRKEMEDMSKKTRKLEKENEGLKRKVDGLNANILRMAEERSKHIRSHDDLHKKNVKLTSIINQMQQQGRGIAQGNASEPACYTGPHTTNNHPTHDEGEDDEGEEEDEEEPEGSDYEYEEEEVEEGEVDEDTEEDFEHQQRLNAASAGPGRMAPPAAASNGHI